MAWEDAKELYAGPGLVDPVVTILRTGWDEPMPPCVIDRPQGTGDVLVMYFHEAAVVDEAEWPAGALRCWPAGARQHYGHPDVTWRHSWAHLAGPLAEALCDHLPRLIELAEDRPTVRHLRHLATCCSRDRDPDLAAHAAHGLLRAVALDRGATTAPDPWGDLQRWMERHCGDDLRLDDLAKRTGLRRSRFSQCFNDRFGLPPMRYLQELRLTRARWLLLDHNRSITDIARTVGLPDLGYFGRIMRRRFGASPRQLREQHVGRQGRLSSDAIDG